jgi:HAD superfamily hydrolase (TIGR01509 family)
MIRCVLFDLDGTLVDSWALYVEAYVRTLEPRLGRRLTLDELLAMRPASEIRFLRQHLDPADLAPAHDAFLRHYRDLHATHFEGVYAGVPTMLTGLRERAVQLGIVTGKSRPAWEITSREVDLGPFAVVITDEDVREAKPSPEGLRRALQALSAGPDEAIYVGDSLPDAGAAQQAGMRFAAALWPKADREVGAFRIRVHEIGVWAELKRPEDLLAELDRPRDSHQCIL